MSKLKAASIMIMVNPNEIGWIPEHNYGKHSVLFDHEEEKLAHAVQLKDGWWADAIVKVVAITTETKAKLEAYLAAEWKKLSERLNEFSYPTEGTKTSLSAAQVREAFKMRFFKGDKLDVSKVKYEGVYAFQRGGAIDYANALRISKGLSVLDAIPVMVMEYDSTADRIRDCILENTGKIAGFKDVSNHWPTLIKAASAYFNEKSGNVTLSEITKMVTGGDVAQAKVGRGQKAFSILALNYKFPKLGIVDKIVNAGIGDKDGKKGVDLGQDFGESLSRASLIDLEKGTRADAEEPVSEADVAEYIADPKAGNSAAVKMMNKTNITTRANITPNNLVKFILHCVLNDKVETLAKTFDDAKVAEACNKVAAEFSIEIKK